MNVSSQSPHHSSRRSVIAVWLPALAAASMLFAHAAFAGNVECMLPGEIHNVGGHPTMGPRHPVQTTEEDCKQRGGEYTVQDQSPPPSASPMASADTTQIRCLLPRQTRQLGSKSRYSTKSRVIHTTATDCQGKHGKVLASKAAT